MNFAIALFLKPFVTFVLAFCVLYPARLAVIRYMSEGRLKATLLFRVGGNGTRWTPKLALLWTVVLFSIYAPLVYLASR